MVSTEMTTAQCLPHIETFHSFSRLPTELRLAIWEYSLVPRVLYFTPWPKRLPKNKNLVPVILHVNSESRLFALSKYIKYNIPGSRRPVGRRLDPDEPSFYFNLSIDLWGLGQTFFRNIFCAEPRISVPPYPKHVFLGTSLQVVWNELDGLQLENSAELWAKKLPNLETVSAVPVNEQAAMRKHLEQGRICLGLREARPEEITSGDNVLRWGQTFGNDNPRISESYSGMKKIEYKLLMPVYDDDAEGKHVEYVMWGTQLSTGPLTGVSSP